VQPDLILMLPKVNDKHHKQISGNVWFTVRRIFLKPEHGASETLAKMICFACTECHPMMPGQDDYTPTQLRRFVGMVSRDRAIDGCFKFPRSKINSTTMIKHAEHLKADKHKALWAFLLRWMATKIIVTPKLRLGAGRKRLHADTNTQALASCWDLKSHAKMQKLDPRQVKFVRDLVILVAKSLCSLSLVQSKWFQRLLLRQTPSLTFPTRRL
jgi:hypothetical protein